MDKNEFRSRLEKLGLSIKGFALLANIPASTVKGWMATRPNRAPKTPTWVKPFLDLYEENQKFQHALEILKK